MTYPGVREQATDILPPHIKHVLSISLDELAIGFSIGLLGLPICQAVILIGLQAFAVAQIGLRLGARLSARYREAAEKLAGLALIGLAILLLIEKA